MTNKENDKIFNLSYEDIINLFKKYNKPINKELLEDLPFFLETLKKNHNVLLKLGENKEEIPKDKFEDIFNYFFEEDEDVDIEILSTSGEKRSLKKELLGIYRKLKEENDNLKKENDNLNKQMKIDKGLFDHRLDKKNERIQKDIEKIEELQKENESLKAQLLPDINKLDPYGDDD